METGAAAVLQALMQMESLWQITAVSLISYEKNKPIIFR